MVEQTLRHFVRYQEIIALLIRNGLGFFLFEQWGGKKLVLEKDLAQVGGKIRNFLGQLGPTFIKVGQFAATRPDIIPEPIIKELSFLQDKAPAMKFDFIKRTIEQELGKKLAQVFREFDPVPLASASIGQVHHAVLHSGETVAVKVQRPGLELEIKTDLEIIEKILILIEQRFPDLKDFELQGMLNQFACWLEKELDYTLERKNAEEIYRQYQRQKSQVIIPRVYEGLSTKRILTMSYIDGIKLNEEKKLEEAQLDKRELAQKICKAIFRQILGGGYFHGDPHQGNIFVLPDQKIAFVDFGIVGCVPPAMKKGLRKLIGGFVCRNAKATAKAMEQLGFVPKGSDLESLKHDLSNFQRQYLEVPLNKLSLSKLTTQIAGFGKNHQLNVPEDFILLGKTLATLEGVVYNLDPTMTLSKMVKVFPSLKGIKRFKSI